MNTLAIAKSIGSFMASVGAGAIVYRVVSTVVPAGSGRIRKAFYTVGAFGIAGAVGDKAAEFVEKEIEETYDAVQAIKVGIREIKETINRGKEDLDTVVVNEKSENTSNVSYLNGETGEDS